MFDELQHEYYELENSFRNDERIMVAKNSQIHQLRKENERLRREIRGSKEEMERESSQNSISDVTSSLVFSETNNSYLE